MENHETKGVKVKGVKTEGIGNLRGNREPQRQRKFAYSLIITSYS